MDARLYFKFMRWTSAVLAELKHGVAQVAALNDAMLEQEHPATPMVQEALRMLDGLRTIANNATQRIAQYANVPPADVHRLIRKPRAEELAGQGNGYLGIDHLLETPRWWQRDFNRQMDAAVADRLAELRNARDRLYADSRRFSRRLVVRAVEFRPFLEYYLRSPPPTTARRLSEADPWQVQYVFHQLFQGNYTLTPVHHLAINWNEAPLSVVGTDGRHYCPCGCGCQGAATRFLNNMAGGWGCRELALSDNYQDCIIDQTLDLQFNIV